LRWRPDLPVRSVRAIWTIRNSAEKVSSETKREKGAEKTMGRRKLSLKAQLKGVRAAISSKRTPPQLRAGLRKRAEWLAKQVRKEIWLA
jgi:signal transduction histidine kinase